jgi:hypothetical protein
MNEERTDPIDEEELPQAGNSEARIYPPMEEADEADGDDDPQQPATGDAAAIRDGEDQQAARD